MRALVVEPGPAFSVQDVHNGICSGLASNGIATQSFNLADRLNFYCNVEINGSKALEYEDAARAAISGLGYAVLTWRPQVVVIVSSFYVPPEMYRALRQNGVHVVLWLTESPYEDARQIPMAGYADTVIVNDPTNIDQFREQNKRAWYIPHGYNPDVHHDADRTDEHPFCFVGTGYPSRIEYLEKAELPDGSVLAGNWTHVGEDSPIAGFLMDERDQCIDNTDAAGLYRSSVTSLNIYRKEAMSPDLVEGWAIGPREVELAMCGTWFAREPRGEGDELFPMLPKVTEPGELGDVIRWALANPDARNEATRLARRAVADRSFHHNVGRLLHHIA